MRPSRKAAATAMCLRIFRAALCRPPRRSRQCRQNADEDKTCRHRTPAVTNERQGDPGERQKFRHTRRDDKRLQQETCSTSRRKQRLLRPRQSHRNAAAAPEEQRIAHEDKNRPEQAELLGNRRKDEVRMHLGNKMRMSLRKSRSPDAACADGKE